MSDAAAPDKRKNAGALSVPQPISVALEAIVGSGPLPRGEITKRLWDYIKANGLQDQANKRMIVADDKLRELFGGLSTVSMFEMTALVNQHIGAAMNAASYVEAH